MTPKDKDSKLQKIGVIYQFKCPHINCPEEYIGESGRAFWYRIKDQLKAPSAICQHSSSTGHPLSPDCFTIIHREAQGTSRNIKEAMFIYVNDPSLNRNLGKYQLPHIQDNILQDTPALVPIPPSPPPTWTTPPFCTHQSRWGHVLFLIGKYSFLQGCPPHTPNPTILYPTPLHPYSPLFQ